MSVHDQEPREDWNFTVLSRIASESTIRCGQGSFLIASRTNGWAATPRMYCGCWLCRPSCGIKKARHCLEHCGIIAATDGGMYFAMSPCDEITRKRLNQRAHRANADTLRVEQFKGNCYVFSSQNLSGRSAPANFQWVNQADVMHLMREAVLVPGRVVKVRWSDGWRPAKRRRNPDIERIGKVPPGRDVIGEATSEFIGRYGYPPDEGMRTEHIMDWLHMLRRRTDQSGT
jgi:hypothetical protein